MIIYIRFGLPPARGTSPEIASHNARFRGAVLIDSVGWRHVSSVTESKRAIQSLTDPDGCPVNTRFARTDPEMEASPAFRWRSQLRARCSRRKWR
jgi:hypothetical protein